MNFKKLYITLFALLFVGASFAQKGYSDIEETQDEIERIYVRAFEIIETYPDVTYDYVYTDGIVDQVIIKGMPDNKDKKRLEVYLMDLEDHKRAIYNMNNRMGVYYVAETEPEPKTSMIKFYDELHDNLEYPNEAKKSNIEGTVFVKFVVDRNGNVDNIVASENIESNSDWIVNEMKREAIEAVELTSGDWKPAKVGEVPVAHWVVIPVNFNLESPIVPYNRLGE